METSYSRAEKSVGLFVIGIAVLMLTTVVILGRGKDWFAEEVTFYTSFKESYNLQVNAAVKLFKADIGKVKRISLGEDNVNVQLAILAKYASRIRQDSVAVVDSPTLIGSEYISIVPGASNSQKIPVGGMIPSIEKKSIPDILKEFEVEKTAMLTVRTIQDLAGLVTLMKDPKGPLLTTLANIKKTTAHLEQITRGIGQGQGSLGSLVASRELVDGVLSNLERVDGLLDDLRLTAGRGPVLMDQVSDNLATIRTAGDGVVENVRTLKDILEDVRGSLITTRAILANLKQGSQDIPRVTLTAREGIREIREGVENIDRVVQSLQRNVIIRSNLPDEPLSMDTDAGVRP
ncbi:paraquat-inducible protein B [Desulfosarcina alkanivorans]|uniref:Paraquat-inducible protein B n=1 Tax=Desulfosarcina alkanivorans TaxID=571177 RepID=A0A5K7YRQ5_9BACT|nr:MlaD family protein [Desulfosarcina alkanivorans]BBO70609.1 paraquat-inducible protein B [Desulfosarcina alkanivorans]